VPAAGVVAEAMVALLVADAVTEKFGGDSVPEVRRNVQAYLATLGATLPIAPSTDFAPDSAGVDSAGADSVDVELVTGAEPVVTEATAEEPAVSSVPTR